MTPKPPKNDKPMGEQKPPRRRAVPPEVSSARKYMAWELRVTNPRMTFRDITKAINLKFPEFPLRSDHQAVEKMIKEAEKEFTTEHKSKVDDIKNEAAVALDWARQEASLAWIKSRDQIVDMEFDEDVKVIQKLVVTAGNAQYLKRLIEAVETKTKIFGAQAPKKHEVTGKDGQPLVPDAVDFKALGRHLSDGDLDILQKAASIIERAKRDLAAAVIEGS